MAVALTADRLASHNREIEMGRFLDLMDRELRIRGLADKPQGSFSYMLGADRPAGPTVQLSGTFF